MRFFLLPFSISSPHIFHPFHLILPFSVSLLSLSSRFSFPLCSFSPLPPSVPHLSLFFHISPILLSPISLFSFMFLLYSPAPPLPHLSFIATRPSAVNASAFPCFSRFPSLSPLISPFVPSTFPSLFPYPLFSQTSPAFPCFLSQNLHPTFYYILTSTLLYGIVT